MFDYRQKLSDVYNALSNILETKDIIGCLMSLHTSFIRQIMTEPPNQKGMEFLISFGKQQGPKTKARDLYSTINAMKYRARERSNGACQLTHLYLNISEFRRFLQESQPSVIIGSGLEELYKPEYKVSGVKLIPTDCIEKRDLIGLCTSKFDIIEPKLLIIRGEVDANIN